MTTKAQEERSVDLSKRLKKLGQDSDYLDRYIDSVEFLLIGIALGVLGGVWSDVLLDWLKNIFKEAYIDILTLISLVAVYFLSFPIRRARKKLNKNKVTLKKLEEEYERSQLNRL